MPWGAFGLIWFCVTLSVLACFNSLFAMGSLRPRRGSPGRRRAGVSIRPMRWGVFGRAGLGDLWLLAGVSIRPLRWGAFGRRDLRFPRGGLVVSICPLRLGTFGIGRQITISWLKVSIRFVR